MRGWDEVEPQVSILAPLTNAQTCEFNDLKNSLAKLDAQNKEDEESQEEEGVDREEGTDGGRANVGQITSSLLNYDGGIKLCEEALQIMHKRASEGEVVARILAFEK